MTDTLELQEPAQLDAEMINALPINDLVEIWQDVKHHDDWVASIKKASGANLDTVRAAMERRLREAGSTSHTDAASGVNVRIETRRDWKITDPKSVTEFFRRTERFELLTVDAKAAIDYRKAEGSYPIPGIEQVESKRLVVTAPKNGGK